MSRTIATKLAIDGEAEYKAAVKSCKDQMALYRSELNKVTAEAGTNSKSVETLTAKNKILSEQITAQKDKVQATKDILAKAAEAYGENSKEVQTYQKELNHAEAALAKMENQLKANNEQLADMKNKAKIAGEAMQTSGDNISKVGGKIESFGNKASIATAAIAGLSAAAVESWKEVDEGFDTIIMKTGASGDAFDSLQASAEKVYTSLPVEIGDVGAAIGEVNTRFDVTGERLEDLSSSFLEFAEINNTDVSKSVESTSKIMAAWNVDVSKTGDLLGMISSVSQRTGVATDSLMTKVLDNNATFKELGLSLEQSINLMAAFEKNGVESSTALMGLKKAAVSAAKDGLSLKDAMSQTIDSIKNAASSTDALNAASELFGSRGAVEMTTAIKEGRIDLNNLSDDISNYGDVVNDTFEATLDPIDDAKTAINGVKLTLSEFGGEILKSGTPIIEGFGEGVRKLSAWFDGLNENQKQTVIKTTAVIAAAGPLISITGKLTSGVGSAVTAGGKFLTWLSKAKSGSGEAVSGVSKLASVIGSSGPLGIGMAAVAAGAVTYTAAVSLINSKNQEAFRSMEKFRSSMDEFEDNVSSATGILSGFNAESFITSEQYAEISDGVTECRNKILEIADNVATESRKLTENERTEIQNLIDTIDSYLGKKIDMYMNQQKVVEAMISNEESLNNKSLANYVKSAQDTYDQTISLAETNRSERYAIAIRAYGENGQLDLQAYNRAIQYAENQHTVEISSALKTKSQSLKILAEKYFDQNLANNENIENIKKMYQELEELQAKRDDARKNHAELAARQLNIAVATKEKELSDLFASTENENLATWLKLVSDAAQGGENVAEKYREIYNNVYTIISTLPPEVQSLFKDVIKGAIAGIDEKSPELFSKVYLMNKELEKKMRSPWEINSPSKVMIRMWRDEIMGGAVIGLQNGSDKLNDEVEKANTSLLEKFSASASDYSYKPKITAIPELSHSGLSQELTETLIAQESNLRANLYAPIPSPASSQQYQFLDSAPKVNINFSGDVIINNDNDIHSLGRKLGTAIKDSSRGRGGGNGQIP